MSQQQFYTEGNDPLDISIAAISPIVGSSAVWKKKKQLNLKGFDCNSKIGSYKSGNGFQGGSVDGRRGINNNNLHSPLEVKNQVNFTRRNIQKYQQHLETKIANIQSANKFIFQEPLLQDYNSNQKNYQQKQSAAGIYTPLSSKTTQHRILTHNDSSQKRRISTEFYEKEITNNQNKSEIIQGFYSQQENNDHLNDSSINLIQKEQPNPRDNNISQCIYSTNSNQVNENYNNNHNKNNEISLTSKKNQARLRKPFLQIFNQTSNCNNIPNRTVNKYIEKTQSDLTQMHVPQFLSNERRNNIVNIINSQQPFTPADSTGNIPINFTANLAKNIQPRGQSKEPNMSQSIRNQEKSSRGSSLMQRASQIHTQPEKTSVRQQFQDLQDNQDVPMYPVDVQINSNHSVLFPKSSNANKQNSFSKNFIFEQQSYNKTSKNQSKDRDNKHIHNNLIGRNSPQGIINNINNINQQNYQQITNINTPTTSSTPSQMKYVLQQNHRVNNHYSQNSRSNYQSNLGTRANSPFSKKSTVNNSKLHVEVQEIGNQIGGRRRGKMGYEDGKIIDSYVFLDVSPNNINLNSYSKQSNENNILGVGRNNLYIQTQSENNNNNTDEEEIINQNRQNNKRINSSVMRNDKYNNLDSNQLQTQSYLNERLLTVHNDSEELQLLTKKQYRYVNHSQPRRLQEQEQQQLNIGTSNNNNMVCSNKISENYMEESQLLKEYQSVNQKIQRNKRNNDEQRSVVYSSQHNNSKINQLDNNIPNQPYISENNENQKQRKDNINQNQQQRQEKEIKLETSQVSNQGDNSFSQNNISKKKLQNQQGDKSQVTTSASNGDNNTVSVPVASSIQDNQNNNILPKVKWDLSDEEWDKFGDRFPKTILKKKLLGRGGFALVWLGENKTTKEMYAIKQIQSRNSHQTHIKEIWFGSIFFKNGQPKEKFLQYRGIQNLSKLIQFDIQPIDTWMYYELCGKSLGSCLYELKGGDKSKGEDRIYKIHKKKLYLEMQRNLKPLKKLIFELASALWLLSDQRIVHSDLKTENILVKTNDTENSIEIDQVKLIDYGSSFTFGNLKHFSMATPEYMAPEILNFILYQNKLHHLPELLVYLKDYTKTYVIDIWSLGCVILEIINGVPLWMSLQTKISQNGQEFIRQGLFAAKGRAFEQIILKQIDVVNRIDSILDEQNFSGIVVDQELRNLLKTMLIIDPSRRISPRDVCKYLQMSVLGTEFVDIVNEDQSQQKI